MPFTATPKFPGAVMGVADIGNLKDYIAGTTKPTLSASLTSGATSFSVATGTGATLPADNFTVTIDSEEMFVTTRSSDALSGITRGVNGTSAASHLSAAPVNHFITANLINQLAAEVNALENWGAWQNSPDRPPVTRNAMDDEFDGGSLNSPNNIWTWVNQGSATETQANSCAIFSCASNGSAHVARFISQTLPSPPYTFTAKVLVHALSNQGAGGLFLYESGSGKFVMTGAQFTNLAGTGYGTFVASATANRYFTIAGQTPLVSWLYVKVNRTSTTLSYYASGNGISYDLVYTSSLTADFTTAPDTVGVGLDPYNIATVVDIDWFRRIL